MEQFHFTQTQPSEEHTQITYYDSLLMNANPHSPLQEFKINRTPSTNHESNPHEDIQDIEEFNLGGESYNITTKPAGKASVQGKENPRHVTDRFIPLRKKGLKENNYKMKVAQKKECRRGQQIKQNNKISIEDAYKCVLFEQAEEKIFSFNNKCKMQEHSPWRNPPQPITRNLKLQEKCAPNLRKIDKIPYKVLDAPNLLDDFYLNLLEWSRQNILSVALDSSLYLWNANNNNVLRFCDSAPCIITSTNWNRSGTHIAIGNNQGNVEIWDVGRSTKIHDLQGHHSRVSSLSWSCDNLIASGSRDKVIKIRDFRLNPNSVVQVYEGHSQEVCGLKWSLDGGLLASGGNDNKLMIWSKHSPMAMSKFHHHSAAVKGLAWNPHNHGVLLSGGGSADKTIKFWNTLDSSLIDSIDTGSQVCNLAFSSETKEFISTHGFSNNEIIIWKYPTLEKVTTLTGHTSRVLYLALNPGGDSIVTGAGDETLRFWSILPKKTYEGKSDSMITNMGELR